jgi:TonB-dependent SusC/RagA subfamily outer membrane receptor
VGRISRLIAPFALLGTAACAADGPLAPQLAPEPEPAARADVTPGPDAAASSQPSIRLRCGGATLAQGAPPPVYVVDGRVLPAESIGDVDPTSIDHIELIRGAAAVARYGERAGNGVVIITTRRAPGRD